MKKLTIMVSDEFYDGLRRRVGPRGIGRLIENLARDYVIRKSLADHYREASQDEEAEREAMEWVEADLGDTLPNEDWGGLRDAAERGLVGEVRSGRRGRDQEDAPSRDRLERRGECRSE